MSQVVDCSLRPCVSNQPVLILAVLAAITFFINRSSLCGLFFQWVSRLYSLVVYGVVWCIRLLGCEQRGSRWLPFTRQEQRHPESGLSYRSVGKTFILNLDWP